MPRQLAIKKTTEDYLIGLTADELQRQSQSNKENPCKV